MRKKVFIIILAIISIILIICGLGVVFFIKDMDDKVSLIQENVIIEYGEKYDPSLEKLIDLERFDYINKQKVEIKSNIENEQNKEYPAVGTYEIKVTYKDKNLIQRVEVKDTISPELNIQESIEIEKGVDLATIDFNQYITKSDLSKMKDYRIDFSSVDTNKSGEYDLKVSIEDIYGNTSEKEFKIIIPEVVEKNQTVITEQGNINSTSSSSKKTTGNSSNQNNTTISTKNTNKTTQSSKAESVTTNKTESTNSSSNQNTNNTSINNSTSTPSDLAYWCVEGGTHHVAGDGANEHGYYSSWNEAQNAFENYTKGWKSVQYKISQCMCGKFYFWAIQ